MRYRTLPAAVRRSPSPDDRVHLPRPGLPEARHGRGLAGAPLVGAGRGGVGGRRARPRRAAARTPTPTSSRPPTTPSWPPSSPAWWCSTRSSASAWSRRPPPATASASTPRWSPPAPCPSRTASAWSAERGEAMRRGGRRPGRARWARSSGSTTTRSRSPAPGSTATSGSPTTTPRARWSSPASPEAVDEAAAVAKELGAKKVMPMAVSGAFHTPLMAPARDRLRKAIGAAELRDPEIPVYANVDARPHPAADEWAGLLAAQLCSPVRWRQTLAQPGRCRRRTRLRRARAGHRAHRHGEAHRHRRRDPLGGHARGPRRAARRPGHPASSATAAPTRASTSSPPSGSWSAPPRGCSSPSATVAAG